MTEHAWKLVGKGVLRFSVLGQLLVKRAVIKHRTVTKEPNGEWRVTSTEVYVSFMLGQRKIIDKFLHEFGRLFEIRYRHAW